MTRHRSNGQLVCQHLERISRRALEDYQEVIRKFVRGRHGVYALYRKERLYYVGLASNLRSRLKHHLRDRHAQTWDRFSVYLTIGDQHLRELEALLLRITRPPGNRVAGKFTRSEDLRRILRRRVRQAQQSELEALLCGDTEKKPPSHQHAGRVTSGRMPVLATYITCGLKLRFRYKGTLYTARVRPDGRIRYGGKPFNSPSLAASAITRRPMNGWTTWSYERAPGDWVLLDQLRK